VFVPSIELRLLAQSDLHGRVATLLSEEGIEIAFQQMDLHVRDLPAAIAPASPPAEPGQTPAPSP
jgi:potassium efflux system protein